MSVTIRKFLPLELWLKRIEINACTPNVMSRILLNMWYRLPDSVLQEINVVYSDGKWYNGLDLKHFPNYFCIQIKIQDQEYISRLGARLLLQCKQWADAAEDIPIKFPSFDRNKNTPLWAFKGSIYSVEYHNQISYSDEEEQLLVLEFWDSERQKFERLRRLYTSDTVERESHNRERIPEEVRIAVWRRDDGKCARCGSRENLEYDHIVPISIGGSNTARNIELLCEKCNRAKGNHVG